MINLQLEVSLWEIFSFSGSQHFGEVIQKNHIFSFLLVLSPIFLFLCSSSCSQEIRETLRMGFFQWFCEALIGLLKVVQRTTEEKIPFLQTLTKYHHNSLWRSDNMIFALLQISNAALGFFASSRLSPLETNLQAS